MALLSASFPFLTETALHAEPPADNRFNVLFIAIDDLRPELGCYDVNYAQSPHIDRFAESAVVFRRHYVQVATCGASRYALLTGRSPARSGVTRNNGAFYSRPSSLSVAQQPGAQSFPELFRRSGYRTVCIGKISHTADGRVYAYNGSGDGRDEIPHAWDELATPMGDWKRGWGIFFAYANGKHREDGGDHIDLMEFTAERDTDLPDGLLAESAIDRLRQFKGNPDGKPFFMGLGFFKPHLPFVAPKEDWEAFAGVDIPIPESASDNDPTTSPYWSRSNEFFKYDAPYEKTRPLEPDAIRTARRAYLACVRYTDRQVGKVLKALDDLQLSDNTVVVIWGDHGWFLGERQMWAKHTPWELANRSVLMMRAPGIHVPGAHSGALVETIDIYPTLVDLCRPRFTETHTPLDGKSLLPLLQGERQDHREAAISYWGNAVSVRTDRYRLIATLDPDDPSRTPSQIELYNFTERYAPYQNVADLRPTIVERLLSHLPTNQP